MRICGKKPPRRTHGSLRPRHFALKEAQRPTRKFSDPHKTKPKLARFSPEQSMTNVRWEPAKMGSNNGRDTLKITGPELVGTDTLEWSLLFI